jgi:hypothetical protein
MKKLMLVSAITMAFMSSVTTASAFAAEAAAPAKPAGMPAYAKDKAVPSPHSA